MCPTKNVGFEIKNLENYILVQANGMVIFFDIIRSIAKLFTMNAYQEKNDIWVFQNGDVNCLFSDLHEIKNFIKENYPKKAIPRKTAVVAKNHRQLELVKDYVPIFKDLPREIKIFADFESASNWITNSHLKTEQN